MSEPETAKQTKKVPRHLAIIMDGNGRWASERGRLRHLGHRKGVDTVKTIVKAAREQGIEFLTLYSFSTENWSRPKEEVNELFKLLKLFIRRDLAELHQNQVRVKIIGQRDNLPSDILALLDEAESLTKDNRAQTLIVAFNYGSRQEIVSAARKLAVKVAAGEMSADDITETTLENALDTRGIPDPDLILRTAGEYRLSNFLMWQASYAEFAFVEKYWPDFTADDLENVLVNYSMRQRKFGGLAGTSSKEKVIREAGS
jgi:undecaprenyl diphosphate synthase